MTMARLKGKPFVFLLDLYNPVPYDANPPSVIGSLPTEYLSTIKRPLEGKLLVMR